MGTILDSDYADGFGTPKSITLTYTGTPSDVVAFCFVLLDDVDTVAPEISSVAMTLGNDGTVNAEVLWLGRGS